MMFATDDDFPLLQLHTEKELTSYTLLLCSKTSPGGRGLPDRSAPDDPKIKAACLGSARLRGGACGGFEQQPWLLLRGPPGSQAWCSDGVRYGVYLVDYRVECIGALEKKPWRLNPRLLKDRDATKSGAGLLDSSLLGNQDLGGSEWDAVKAGVAKRPVLEEHVGIKVVPDVILQLSKPLSGSPGVTTALTSLRKKYRVLLQ
ncbi:hypothetical protein MRX96_041366 [Rhipicephalus microplus]